MPRRPPPRPTADELRTLLYRDQILLRLARISLAAHAENQLEAADVLNQACDCLGRALDLLGANRRRKSESPARPETPPAGNHPTAPLPTDNP